MLALLSGAALLAQSTPTAPGNSGNAGSMGNRPENAGPSVGNTMVLPPSATSSTTTPPASVPGPTMTGGVMSGGTGSTTTGVTAGTGAGPTMPPATGGTSTTPPAGSGRPTPTVNENASDNAKAVQTLLNAFDAKRDAFIAERQKLVDQLAAAKTEEEKAKILADMKKEQELRQDEQRDLAKEIRGQLKSLREQRKNGGG